jgi:peptidoglycan hydrolase CwlO-like protein
VEKVNITEKIDIDKLNDQIAKIVSKQSRLRNDIDKIISDLYGDVT